MAEQHTTVAASSDAGESVPAWAVQLLIDVAVIKNKLEPIKDQETRIRTLEKRSWSLAGVSTIAGASLAQLITYLTNGGPSS